MRLSTILVTLLVIVSICLVAISAQSLADQSYSRVAYLDIDKLADDDDVQQEETNMDNAVAHVIKQGANTVFIQAYRDMEGFTRVSKMYFPNEKLGAHMPERNHFVKLANKFAAKGILVGAWMPILAYQVTTINGKDAQYILTRNSDGTVARQPCTLSAFYCNLSPFASDNFDFVLSIYKDLIKAYPDLYIINGHDDAAMNDQQDMSPPALAAYAAAGLPSTPDALHALDWDSPELLQWESLQNQNQGNECFLTG